MNNHTHECIIRGDTNDGDYIDTSFTFNPHEPDPILFEENKFFDGHPSVGTMEFLNTLGTTLLFPREDYHNWSRQEYDNRKASNETITHVFSMLFGVDLNSEEFQSKFDDDFSKYEDIFDTAYEEISELLPFGEFGIHTIDSIKVRPIPQVGHTIFGSPGYRKNNARVQKLNKADFAILMISHAGVKQVAFYDTSSIPFRVCSNLEKAEWKVTEITSITHVLQLGNVIWVANGFDMGALI
ncbi:hypothetical protein Acj133p109 [Acinetobacter phage 133]|uniref:Uncharacterized protein n=1 Tax=Acinetobacter phage 133 TaxID=2919552 RepID=D9I643_9CAUD|nr:hypothetical protein Acj133p109 [Acinetobacter phage 133]ADJ19424.1 hypothetical protein Acj133p109 [Acinetobacter phage 133]